MRDLFRLLAVGVMSLAIVGLAMVYSRGGDAATVFEAVSSQVASTVDGIGSSIAGGAAASPAPVPATYTLDIARPRAAEWIGLAGFPDQSEIAFPIPRAASYVSGALDLVFDTQLTNNGDGLLTLSVNGSPRGQLVLDSGRQTHQVRIELTAADLGSDRVVLHMAARGTTNSGQVCPVDAANSGSAITLVAASRLELVSDTAPTDAIGALLAPSATLALQPGTNAGDTALAIWANQQLDRSGLDARLSAGGPGETPVVVTTHATTAAGLASANVLAGERAVLDFVAAAGPALALPGGGTMTVADLGGETIVKSFRGSRRWTVNFAAADMPGGALPETFSLRLKATPLSGDNQWSVRVSLNGNLIETYRVAGNSDMLSFDVPLPSDRLLPNNTLITELVDTTPNEGICSRAPDAQAQLLPESSLIDTAPASVGWATLIETLAASPEIALTADGLNIAQASRASDLIGLVLPRPARVAFDGSAPVQLRAIPGAALPAALTASSEARVLLPVSTNAGASLAVMTPGADLDAALLRLGADDVVILVTTR